MTDVLVEELQKVLDPDADLGNYSMLLETESQRIEDSLQIIRENMDIFFLLIISFIVFFLQAGFAFLEVGSVRSKNATNILIKNMLDVFLGGIAFWLVGYPIAFGKGNGVIGTTYWASSGLPDLEYAKWCFQFVFAATAATIVSGSVAERCSFHAYFIYSIMLTGFIYPVIAHWAWSGDAWLGQGGYHDFAGSGVVHLTGGVSALVGAMMLGPRIGRFDHRDSSISGHSVPLAGLGGFILLFGFLAFNGGSQGAISNPGDGVVVAKAVVNTIISGCSGGITVLIIYRLAGESKWSFLMTLNGALTGMVSICAGCDTVRPWGALITGTTAGFVYFGIHRLMIKLKIDDPLDAVAVHMGGGMWGLLSTSFFMEDGIVYGKMTGFKTLGWNLAGMLTIILWAGGLCVIMFGALRFFNLLRVSPEMEVKGLDILKHGEPAYPVDAWVEEQYYAKSEEQKKLQRRHSGLPMNMNPPPTAFHPTEDVYSMSSFYPQNPHGHTLPPESRRHFGPPNVRPVQTQYNINTITYTPAQSAGKTNNRSKPSGKMNGIVNDALEMETR